MDHVSTEALTTGWTNSTILNTTEKITCLSEVTQKRYHIKLHRVHHITDTNRSHIFSGETF